MTCTELQESLEQTEYGTSLEQQNHLRTCPECAALVRELNLISSSAVQLRAADEPSPRVWNSIQLALQREGLIHPPRPARTALPSFGNSRGWARWLVPVAALLLITVGVYVRQHSSTQVATNIEPAVSVEPTSEAALAGLNDADLLQEIAQQSPAMKAQYEQDLSRVNQYIQDAREVVATDPNDEEAHRSLLEAYQEKAMLFELAMDRSLP